jgi:hypothetical protein
MQQVSLYSPKFKLRWGFEYKDGRIKRGMWNNPGKNMVDQAWANNKNILYAFIERRNDHNAEVKQIVRCTADEFLNFQWVCSALSPNIMTIKGGVTPITAISGLTMLTVNKAVDCFVDGRVKTSDARHLDVNFKTFGK